ncbi:MAG TPA: lysophospholipid acyltransferase family protein [Chitinophagaceae bacterium]|nr:lysophospholipid acyltransferase family protein [Chitinophagaceae bacterium]
MYYVVYGLLYLFSLLPLQVLYLFGDLAFLVIYYIAGYRRKVVAANLLIAFPDKTKQERKKIAWKFYRSFTDNLFELIKLISANKKFIQKHFTGDFSVFEEIHKNMGKRSQFLLSHQFNWELACLGIPLNIPQLFLVAYMPPSSRIADRLIQKIRLRTGCALVSVYDIGKSMIRYRNREYVLALVADQNPRQSGERYWIRFFGKPAPFEKAPESSARKSNMPVVFGYFKKIKRGYYTSNYFLGAEKPSALNPGELTVQYVRFLEKTISEQPENWLWSHRRWKWDWQSESGELIG